MGEASLPVIAQRRLDNLYIGGGHCPIIGALVFFLRGCPIWRAIVGVGSVPWMCRGLEVRWGVDRRLSILLPNRFLVGQLQTRGTPG